MSSPSITYTPRSGATLETELSALANVYRFVLARSRKEAAPDSRPDDAERNLSDSASNYSTG